MLAYLEGLFDPISADAPWVSALQTFVRETLTRENARAREQSGGFPSHEFSEFARLGLSRWLVPPTVGGALQWSTVTRICARLAEADLAATLCIGGTMLGALPVLLAGNTAQQQQYFEPVLRGEMGGLALSEWAIGSDLNACETRAAAVADGFVLDGEKAPINNGSLGANVVVLARTHDAADAFSTSLFLLDRKQRGMSDGARVPWLGTRAMDLSGVVLREAHVPTSALLGKPGEGFLWVRRTLEISRSGVAAMAVGAAARALERGLRHARERTLYGQPIAALAPVRALLGSAAARTLAITALGRFSAHAVAESPGAARMWSAAAKLVCSRGAEDVVAGCGAVLGARSLIEAFDFDDLRRNVCVLGIFDGSSQLQLDELWRVTSSWRRADGTADPHALWTSAHGNLRDPGNDGLVAQNNVPALLAHHPTLHALALWLGQNAGNLRALDQAVRFEVSELVATLHLFAALSAAITVAPDATALQAAFATLLAEEAPELAARVLAMTTWPNATAVGQALLAHATNKVSAREAMYEATREWPAPQ